MNSDSSIDAREGTTLHDYLHVVRRRKWTIIQALLVVPAAAVAFSLQQQELHVAEAEVLISRQNLAASLTGTIDPSVYQQADRILQTEASLARVPEVARRVLDAADLGRAETPAEFLGRSSVSAKQNADLLEFRVTDPRASLAARLATLYANEFKRYRHELDTAALTRARAEVNDRLKELERSGQGNSALSASLLEKDQQLSTLEALQTSNAFVVRSADDAQMVQPRPVRNAILGLALGLALGLGLAFLRETLDTRIRSADELEQQLDLPLLARIPEPPRELRKDNRLSMLADLHGPHAEIFRMLKMNLEFTRLSSDARTIMVTSAIEREGKSTTVANLAVALARAGQSVCLVDFDLRRPFLERFFDLRDRPGVTHILLGKAELDDALTPIMIPAGETRMPRIVRRSKLEQNGNGNGTGTTSEGVLYVLTAGPTPPNAGELIVNEAVAELLGELRERFTTVLIDAPPLLQVGDATALSRKVDALFLVTRMDVLRRPMVRECRRALEAAPAMKLGFVVTGAESEDTYGYGAYRHAYGAKQKDKVLRG